MAGLFDAARSMMGNSVFCPERITYVSNGLAISADIPAKAGRTVFSYQDRNGIQVRSSRYDFFAKANDLGGHIPKVGDEIFWNGGRYRVSAPNGEPCWRWHDRQREWMRIHAEEMQNG